MDTDQDRRDAERWRQVVAKAREGVSDGQLADHVRDLIGEAGD